MDADSETRGRQPLLQARVPAPMLAALDAAADRSGQTIPALTREILAEGLTTRGVWPPTPRDDDPS